MDQKDRYLFSWSMIKTRVYVCLFRFEPSQKLIMQFNAIIDNWFIEYCMNNIATKPIHTYLLQELRSKGKNLLPQRSCFKIGKYLYWACYFDQESTSTSYEKQKCFFHVKFLLEVNFFTYYSGHCLEYNCTMIEISKMARATIKLAIRKVGKLKPCTVFAPCNANSASLSSLSKELPEKKRE